MSIYNTGTITLTSGLTTVSGYGTSWLAEIEAGDLLVNRGGSIPYTIAGITNSTNLTLQSAWPSATLSGQYYDIFRDFTVNANLAKVYGADRSDWPAILGDAFDKIDHWAIGWNQTSFTCTFASSTSFTCAGDKTTLFGARTRLKIVHAGGTTYHNVSSSTYSSVTTVIIDGTALVNPISKVYHGLMPVGDSGSFPQIYGDIIFDSIVSKGNATISGYHGVGGPGLSAAQPSRIHRESPSGVSQQYTNADTGRTVSDGWLTGIDDDENFEIKSQETDKLFKVTNPTSTPFVISGGITVVSGLRIPGADISFTALTANQLVVTDVNKKLVSSDTLPWIVDIAPTAAPLTSIGWASVVSADMLFAGYLGSDGVQNRECTWPIVLGAGTWSLVFMHSTDTNRGIYTFYLDSTSLGTIDGYSAATVHNVTTLIQNISITTPGKYIFKVKMETKGSGSTYTGIIQHIRFIRAT